MKSLFFVPVILLYTAIFLLTLVFTLYYYFREDFSMTKALVSLGFYICLTMAMINHLLTMTTEPGIVEESKCTEITDEQMKEFQRPANQKNFFKNYCRKCKIMRPERSHHCKTCKRCVLKMDQHCPWMFNCIGLKNQKYYYLFLFYSMIALLIAIVALTNKVLHYEFVPKDGCNDGVFLFNSFKRFKFLGVMINNEVFVIMMQVYCNVSDGMHMALGILLGFCLFIAAFCSFEMQTILFLKNKTYAESIRLKKNQNTPYFFNEKMKNMKAVLGQSKLQWFLPIVAENNGYNFPKPNLEKFKELEDKYNKRPSDKKLVKVDKNKKMAKNE